MKKLMRVRLLEPRSGRGEGGRDKELWLVCMRARTRSSPVCP